MVPKITQKPLNFKRLLVPKRAHLHWAKDQGASGLAYFSIEKDEKLQGKGPIGKFFSSQSLNEIMKKTKAKIGDSIFLACGKKNELYK